MANFPIKLVPGINNVKTPLLLEAGWASCNLIRFFQGQIQKLGGWAKYIGQAVHGICRGIFAWQDLSSNGYVVAGTDSVLQVASGTALYDITPQRSVVNLADQLTTVSGTDHLSIHSVANGVSVGDATNIFTETAINGKLLQGFYDVISITDADNFIVSTGQTFSASVTGSTTAQYNTTNTSPIVTVTLTNHGRVVGQVYTNNVSTTVGGLVIYGSYVVATVPDANTFTFNYGTNAGSTANGKENAGSVRVYLLLHAGGTSSTGSGAYGGGTYGSGTFGIGTIATVTTPARQWFLGNWGELLIANPSQGDIYVWDPGSGLLSNPATVIAAAPTAESIFIAMPERQVVALGAGGDPLLVQWSGVDDYNQWTPAITNQSGSYRLTTGSRIMGGLQGPQAGLIWTDLGLWIMQYIQPPLIYGFTEIGRGCGLIAPRAMGILGSTPFWMSGKNFYVYEGQPTILPCPVWDTIFNNLNPAQTAKITCAPNSDFNEISWFYPSAGGTGEVDSYVKYNKLENVWDYGTLDRTAWMDKSVVANATGVDANGYIQQHEVSNDADGVEMIGYAESGYFKIAEGNSFMFIERMLPDFIFDSTSDSVPATVDLGIDVFNYNSVSGYNKSMSVSTGTEYEVIRLRGRFASIRIDFSGLYSFWRLGEILITGSPSGRR